MKQSLKISYAFLFVLVISFSSQISAQIATSKKEFVNKLSAMASGNFLMSIKPQTKTYMLYDEIKKSNIRVTTDKRDLFLSSLAVLDIVKDDVCHYKFLVLNAQAQVGWVNGCSMEYSDLELAYAIGRLNDDDFEISYKKDFKALFNIDLDEIKRSSNSLKSPFNKDRYTIKKIARKRADTSYFELSQKLFFGFDCDGPIHEYKVNNKREIVSSINPQEKFILKQKNLFRIMLSESGELFVNDERIELRDIKQAVIDFLDNGGVTRQANGYCDYCQGMRKPASSDNPYKAIIGIQNDYEFRPYYKTYSLYEEVREAYRTLWKREAYKMGITEFDKVKCEIRRMYMEKYPVNILYYDKGHNLAPPPPPPPPKAPEIIETIIMDSTDDNESIKKEQALTVPFAIVEKPPLAFGCDSFNNESEKKECVKNRIKAFVDAEFNTNIVNELGIEGRQRIMAVFEINQEGFVKNIRVRAPHPKLKKEAVRVLQLLPKFSPGMQKGSNVSVPYSLPIVLNN